MSRRKILDVKDADKVFVAKEILQKLSKIEERMGKGKRNLDDDSRFLRAHSNLCIELKNLKISDKILEEHINKAINRNAQMSINLNNSIELSKIESDKDKKKQVETICQEKKTFSSSSSSSLSMKNTTTTTSILLHGSG